MKTVSDLVKKAIEHEVNASAFYDQAAEMTNDDEARMVFLELVDIEDGHCQDLIKIFSKNSALSEYDIQGYYEELSDSVKANISLEELRSIKNSGLRDVLEMAVAFEQKAVQTYSGLIEHLPDQELKMFCAKLLEEEKRHEKTLSTLLDNLDMDMEEHPAL